jgi:hypothetical protein
MALIVGGTTVTGTQTLEASTLTGTASAINGSNITNLAAPSNAQILAGVASPSVGAVGSYAFLRKTGGSLSQGTTYSGSLAYASAGSNDGTNGSASGTWRAMGSAPSGGSGGATQMTTTFLRIS